MKKIKYTFVVMLSCIIAIMPLKAEGLEDIISLEGVTSTNQNHPKIVYDFKNTYDTFKLEMSEDGINYENEYTFSSSTYSAGTISLEKWFVNHPSKKLIIKVTAHEQGDWELGTMDLSIPKLPLGKRIDVNFDTNNMYVNLNDVTYKYSPDISGQYFSQYLVHEIDGSYVKKFKNTKNFNEILEIGQRDSIDPAVMSFCPTDNSYFCGKVQKEEINNYLFVSDTNISLRDNDKKALVEGKYYYGYFKINYFEHPNDIGYPVEDVMLYQAVKDNDGNLYLVNYESDKFSYPEETKEEVVEEPKEEANSEQAPMVDLIINPPTGPIGYTQLGLVLVSVCCGTMAIVLKLKDNKKNKELENE